MFQSYGLTHLQIAVRDLEKSVGFYKHLFGMKELFRVGEHMVMLQTPGSKEVITINGNPNVKEVAGKLVGVQHFGFRLREKPDFAKMQDFILNAGGTNFEHGTRGEDGEVWAFFNDPDGYDIELFWAPHD
jgi:catechol 2,3-dioxygenase-like lactoylglutathione lyase family enzyme